MQKFTRRSRTNSDLWFWRMDASSRTPPASSPNEAVPRRRRREHLPDSLSMQSQRPDRHEPMIAAGHYGFDTGDLIRGQSRRHCTGTAQLIFEIAAFLRPTPAVISRCRDARQAKRRGQRHGLLRPFDRTPTSRVDVESDLLHESETLQLQQSSSRMSWNAARLTATSRRSSRRKSDSCRASWRSTETTTSPRSTWSQGPDSSIGVRRTTSDQPRVRDTGFGGIQICPGLALRP